MFGHMPTYSTIANKNMMSGQNKQTYIADFISTSLDSYNTILGTNHTVFVAVSDKNHYSRHLGKSTFHLNHRNICHILITACSKISTLTIFHFILQTHLYIHPTFFYIQKSRVAMAFPVEMAPS